MDLDFGNPDRILDFDSRNPDRTWRWNWIWEILIEFESELVFRKNQILRFRIDLKILILDEWIELRIKTQSLEILNKNLILNLDLKSGGESENSKV